MADTPGKDMPAPDPKSTSGKPGPVKPPVLEGTARPYGTTSKPSETTTTEASAKPADKPATATASATKSGTGTTSRPSGPGAAAATRPDTSGASSGGAAWLAGIVGGLIGLGAAYGLAWFGLWPSPAPSPADPRLAQFATTIPQLQTATGTVQEDLAALTSRIGALETAQAENASAPSSADPAQAEALAALSARLDELAATSGSGDNDEAIAALQADLTSLTGELANINAQLAQSQQQVSALTQSADDTAGANAASLRLPLIFSGLEAAFANGRVYETELAALRQALPQASVPEPITLSADRGLPRPDAVAADLSAALPAMLAGRPVDADANWQDTTVDWFRGLVAMRPAGAVEGDGPDAIVARLEDAVNRRDFVAAQAEFDTLPASMQTAGADVGQDIDSLAAAQLFLAELRSQALTGESGA